MNSFFYLKLAIQNLKKNSKMVVPYILTATLFVMMLFDINALANHSEFVGRSRGMLLSLGIYVIMIFALVFLFYTNSFIIKQRKSELGLYNILGMEKKHISRTLCYETLIMGMISIVLGIGIGILFGQAIFLALVKMVNAMPTMTFEIPKGSIIHVAGFYVIIFIITAIYNISQIHLSKPIDLLKSKNEGEKEPKTKWIMTILGIVCIAIGYYIAYVTKNPMSALSLFFVAVILVIVGTYCLFIAGSIALLKLLRKNKKYYYQTNHFVSVSNMIYRMKQNAVGLANICILSTMVLVMLASTGSLFLGIEDMVSRQAPYDVNMNFNSESLELNRYVDEQIMETISDYDMDNFYREYSFSLAVKFENNELISRDENDLNFGDLYFVYFTVNENIEVKENEIALAINHEAEIDRLKVGANEYQVNNISSELSKEDYDKIFQYNPGFKGLIYIAMESEEALEDLIQNFDFSQYSFVNQAGYSYRFDYDLSEEEQDILREKFNEIVHSYGDLNYQGGMGYGLTFKSDIHKEFYEMFGSFFFVGIFLSILFMIATTLIMYYKQISEGYDDVKRFEILQKVGMSHEEVKRSIHSQILIVFFMPLIVAGIHIMFAFNMIYQLFTAFGLTNQSLFALITVVVYIIFSVFYFIIYELTAKVYYKIVS